MKTYFEWMLRAHLPFVLAIEEAALCKANRWSEQNFIDLFRDQNNVALVIETDAELLGYVVYRVGKTDLSLLRVVVNPKHRRLGFGTQLIGKLVGKVRAHARWNRVTAQVSERFTDVHLWLKANDFMATRVARRAGPTGEDAIAFVLEVPADDKVAFGCQEVIRV